MYRSKCFTMPVGVSVFKSDGKHHVKHILVSAISGDETVTNWVRLIGLLRSTSITVTEGGFFSAAAEHAQKDVSERAAGNP